MNQEICFENTFSEKNISGAIKNVVSKNATPGIDGMKAKELPEYWKIHGSNIIRKIRYQDYFPQPLSVFYKNKPGKKEKREITICTALDQMLQQCIRIEVDRYYSPSFHPDSYGFIKGRGTRNAVTRCLELMNNGYTCIVDADIRKCFDSIKHRIILQLMSERTDETVLTLISHILKNPGISRDGELYYRRTGVPQGSSLSPVLANIVLNELDWKLADMHCPFVRYADDLVLFCRSDYEASDNLLLLESFLTDTLSLELNHEKTEIIPADKLHFLGYSFKKLTGEYVFYLDEWTKEKMKKKMIRHAERIPSSTEDSLSRIGAFNRGWLNYYDCLSSDELDNFIREMDVFETDDIISRLPLYKDHSSAILSSNGYISLREWYRTIKERRRNDND